MPVDFIWPLGKSTAPDEMNTSFGPRINENKWDFHDGVDLPAPLARRFMPCAQEKCIMPVTAVPGGTRPVTS